MTEAELSRLEALEREATPGPWRLDLCEDWGYGTRSAISPCGDVNFSQHYATDKSLKDDAFIVALRNAALELFKALRARDEALAKAAEAVRLREEDGAQLLAVEIDLRKMTARAERAEAECKRLRGETP